MEFTPDERIALAKLALDALCERYRVEMIMNRSGDYFFDVVEEDKKPVLSVVHD